MNKLQGILMLVPSVTLGLALNSAIAEENKALEESVKEYLDTHNLPRREYMVEHGVATNGTGMAYIETYKLGDKNLNCQYNQMPNSYDINVGRFFPVTGKPMFYILGDDTYSDYAMDGINGNEVLFEEEVDTHDRLRREAIKWINNFRATEIIAMSKLNEALKNPNPNKNPYGVFYDDLEQFWMDRFNLTEDDLNDKKTDKD